MPGKPQAAPETATATYVGPHVFEEISKKKWECSCEKIFKLKKEAHRHAVLANLKANAVIAEKEAPAQPPSALLKARTSLPLDTEVRSPILPPVEAIPSPTSTLVAEPAPTASTVSNNSDTEQFEDYQNYAEIEHKAFGRIIGSFWVCACGDGFSKRSHLKTHVKIMKAAPDTEGLPEHPEIPEAYLVLKRALLPKDYIVEHGFPEFKNGKWTCKCGRAFEDQNKCDKHVQRYIEVVHTIRYPPVPKPIPAPVTALFPTPPMDFPVLAPTPTSSAPVKTPSRLILASVTIPIGSPRPILKRGRDSGSSETTPRSAKRVRWGGDSDEEPALFFRELSEPAEELVEEEETDRTMPELNEVIASVGEVEEGEETSKMEAKLGEVGTKMLRLTDKRAQLIDRIEGLENKVDGCKSDLAQIDEELAATREVFKNAQENLSATRKSKADCLSFFRR